MTCPSCGSPGAYVGLAKVECDREGCRHHKAPERVVAVTSPVLRTCIIYGHGTIELTANEPKRVGDHVLTLTSDGYGILVEGPDPNSISVGFAFAEP